MNDHQSELVEIQVSAPQSLQIKYAQDIWLTLSVSWNSNHLRVWPIII